MAATTPQHFKARSGDLRFRWGQFEYPVTPTQFETATCVRHLLLIGYVSSFFCSQRPDSGTITMGVRHTSVDIRRDGRVHRNGSWGAR